MEVHYDHERDINLVILLRFRLRLLNTFGVETSVGVDADDVARIDEKRDLYLRAAHKFGKLAPARDSVAFDGRRGILHFKVNFDRYLYRHRLLFVGEDLNNAI